MSSSASVAGSLAAVLSPAQGTQLLGKATKIRELPLSLPAPPPVDMGFLGVETVWLLEV